MDQPDMEPDAPEPHPAVPSFGEIVERSLAVLERRRRVSHTALRLEFVLDDATFAALREELVDVLAAAEDDGRVLTALAGPATDAEQPAAPAPEAPAQLSVLLCDLEDSTDLHALSPDDRAQVTARVHEICGEVAARLRGHIQPWVSDGVAIFFGHPHPQDDDSLRAVRCGWEILRTVAAMREAIQSDLGLRVSVRLGLATGAVARDAADAFGDTPRVAGRVQAAGSPDMLTVDAATHERTNAHFAFDEHDHEGLYVVSAPLDPGAGSRHAPTPLVGRVGERALLQALAERAAGGTRSAVLIRGEAGVGKSRLIGALAETASGTLGMTVVHCDASPSHRGSALHPLLTGLRRHGIALPDATASMAQMSPGRRRRETFAAIADVLAAEARGAPLLLVVEDLHWADPSTIELIGHLLDGPREVALMVALTARSEFLAPASTALQRIQLGRLDKDETRRLVELVAAEGGTLPDGAATALADRAAGSPLLAEELTRTALATQDSGSAAVTTLFASLLARLDRDSTTRAVAQLAATIGREFDVTLLEAAGAIERSALDWGVERLVEERVVTPIGPGSYAFGHALLQDASRSSLGQESLRDHNLRIARALMLNFPQVAADEPERVARHLEYAGELPEAAEHWRRAGQQALEQYALAEARGHFERGLKVLARTADGDDRRAEELSLRVLAGLSIATRLSWSAPAVVAHYRRAEQLAAHVDDCKQLVPSMLRLTTHRLIDGRVGDALALALRQLAIAQTARDRELVVQAECEAGGALVQLGRHREAFLHLNRAIELHDPAGGGGRSPGFERNPAAISLAHRGLALACRDDRAGARDAIAEAAAVLRSHPHPYSQAWVQCVAAASALICDEREVLLREAAAAIAIASREGFADLLRQASVLHGWARVRSGDHEAGIEECRRGGALPSTTGALVLRPFLQGLLGDALARTGELGQGVAAIDEALLLSARGESWCEPELHRIRAELLLRAGDRQNARRSVQTAVALARRSNAAGWERRAGLTLTRMSSTAPVSQR
ncbi:MAG TPA: AAA family ATPase [Solirubrobacteraceae bacterium]|nr:AAA family ATPase [Solirubrobacteraceae bacterium]